MSPTLRRLLDAFLPARVRRPGPRPVPTARPAALAMAALLLAAAAPPSHADAPIAVRDDRGVTIRLKAPAKRVVSLLPSLTETVCALDACGLLVGTDRYSNWPPEVERLPKAGGLDDANVERIVALKPDLVLAASSARILDRLEALGIPVAALEPKNHADLQRVIGTLGVLLQRPGADRLWTRIQQQTDAAARRIPPGWRGQRLYMEVDSAPYAAAPVSFIGETAQRLGLGNIVPSDGGPFPKLNPEFIVRAQPDLIIASPQALQEMPRRPGWNALKALQQRRVCRFERPTFEVLIRPGPRLGEAAGLLADCVAALEPPKEPAR